MTDRPLHVAIDATPLVEPRPTGVARALAGQLAGLWRADPTVRVTAFAPGDAGPLAEDWPDAWHRLPARGFRRALGKAVDACGADVFFSPFIAVPRLRSVPAVMTVHEVPAVGDVPVEGALRTLRHSAWWAIATRRAAAALAVSEYTASCARARGLALTTEVVPHGVAPAPVTLVRDADAPILAIGTVRKKKGVSLALAAHERLRARGLARRLVWIGDGAPPAHGPAVAFPGYLGDEAVADALSTAACLIVPSFVEGFGLPVLEALARGCPVVAAEAGALPEVLGDAGTLVASRDADAWARAIEAVLGRSPADARERARRGVQRAERYSWDATGATLRAFLGRVAADATSARSRRPR